MEASKPLSEIRILVNELAPKAKLFQEGQGGSQLDYNRFYKAAHYFIEKKYKILPDTFINVGREEKEFSTSSFKIVWNRKEEYSIGDFIFSSLNQWNGNLEYLKYVHYLLIDCHYRVPQFVEMAQIKSDIFTRFLQLKRQYSLSDNEAIKILCSEVPDEKIEYLLVLSQGAASLDVNIGNDEDESFSLLDTIESVDIDPFSKPEDSLIQDIESIETIFKEKDIRDSSKPKIALFVTIALIKKYFKYIDFLFYEELVGKYECISTELEWIEQIYDMKFRENEKKNEVNINQNTYVTTNLFPTQKEQAEKLGITPAAYTQILKNFQEICLKT